MSKHPFRVAMETNANKKDLGKLFAADAVIEAPMLTKPVKGVDDVINIISHAAKFAGPITYTLELREFHADDLVLGGQSRRLCASGGDYPCRR